MNSFKVILKRNPSATPRSSKLFFFLFFFFLSTLEVGFNIHPFQCEKTPSFLVVTRYDSWQNLLKKSMTVGSNLPRNPSCITTWLYTLSDDKVLKVDFKFNLDLDFYWPPTPPRQKPSPTVQLSDLISMLPPIAAPLHMRSSRNSTQWHLAAIGRTINET